MNIYDLAIEELIQENNESCKTLENRIPNVFKALERAKKVAELLGLYQKKEQCIVCVPLMKDSSILHCVVRYSEDEKYMRILKQIKALEEELK